MITFLREWWNCRQKQPSQQESRPGVGGSRRCQSYARFRNSHRKAQNTAGNPKNGEQKWPKLNTVLKKVWKTTKGKCIKVLPQVTRWCQGPELRRFGPLGWFCCVWCQKEHQQGANGETTHKEGLGGWGGGAWGDEWWRLIPEQGNCFVSLCQGAI